VGVGGIGTHRCCRDGVLIPAWDGNIMWHQHDMTPASPLAMDSMNLCRVCSSRRCCTCQPCCCWHSFSPKQQPAEHSAAVYSGHCLVNKLLLVDGCPAE